MTARWTLAGLLCALCAAQLACGNDEQAGPPELIALRAHTPDGTRQNILAADALDTGLPLPPGSFFRAVFDRLLRPENLEEVGMDGTLQGRQDVVSLIWSDAPGGATALPTDLLYQPGTEHDEEGPYLRISGCAPGASARCNRSLPSGAALQLQLNRQVIVGKGGAPFLGPDTFLVNTELFAAAASGLPPIEETDPCLNPPLVSTNFTLRFIFNNLPGDLESEETRVTVTGPGVNASDISVRRFCGDPTGQTLLVNPTQVWPDSVVPTAGLPTPCAQEAAPWPPSATFIAELSSSLRDVWGVPLARPLRVCFRTAMAAVTQTAYGTAETLRQRFP